MAQNGAMVPPLRIVLLKFLPFFGWPPLCRYFLHNPRRPRKCQDFIQRQTDWDENRPGEKNPSGLSFQFFKTEETTSSGKRVVHYRAYISGTPENKKYALTVWKIGSDPHVLSSDVYVNAKGLLMVHKPSPEQENSDFVGDDELQLAVQAARGEPVRYALASTDKELLISGTVVPFPLEDTDRGCRLEVRLAMPDASAVLIYADGLPANAKIPFQMVSAGEPETGKFNVNAQGHAVTTDLPFVYGRDSGSLRVTLVTTECSIAVEVPWGKGSYHPL